MGTGSQMNHVTKVLAEVIQLFRIKFGEQIDQTYVHLRQLSRELSRFVPQYS